MQHFVVLIVCLFGIVTSLPWQYSPVVEDWNGDDFNNTNASVPQNLYVIRAVVYEIGILTNATEDDSDTNETITNERVDLTFFNPDKNGSIIDLSSLPLPVQTNISGNSFAGIIPFNLSSSEVFENKSGLAVPNTLEDIIPSIPVSNNDSLEASSPFINLNLPLQKMTWKSADDSSTTSSVLYNE